jgi:hypothetical protein
MEQVGNVCERVPRMHARPSCCCGPEFAAELVAPEARPGVRLAEMSATGAEVSLRHSARQKAVSRCFLACVGSPYLRPCGHGASIGERHDLGAARAAHGAAGAAHALRRLGARRRRCVHGDRPRRLGVRDPPPPPPPPCDDR